MLGARGVGGRVRVSREVRETVHGHCYNQNTILLYNRVPTAQGKQGKWPKKIPVRENTGNLEILPKHREFGLLKL